MNVSPARRRAPVARGRASTTVVMPSNMTGMNEHHDKVNGQMLAGLFARGAVVKLSEADQEAALAIDGATLFDPAGNGRVIRDTVFLPESVMAEPDELRAWIQKALAHRRRNSVGRT